MLACVQEERFHDAVHRGLVRVDISGLMKFTTDRKFCAFGLALGPRNAKLHRDGSNPLRRYLLLRVRIRVARFSKSKFILLSRHTASRHSSTIYEFSRDILHFLAFDRQTRLEGTLREDFPLLKILVDE